MYDVNRSFTVDMGTIELQNLEFRLYCEYTVHCQIKILTSSLTAEVL